jgi:anti-anti-sigma regulatory factor
MIQKWGKKLNLAMEITESRALVRSSGYVNRLGGERLSCLLLVLATLGVREIYLDLSASPLVCVTAIEQLVDSKTRLSRTGVLVKLVGLTPTLSKVLQIMGFDDHGEIPSPSPENRAVTT